MPKMRAIEFLVVLALLGIWFCWKTIKRSSNNDFRTRYFKNWLVRMIVVLVLTIAVLLFAYFEHQTERRVDESILGSYQNVQITNKLVAESYREGS